MFFTALLRGAISAPPNPLAGTEGQIQAGEREGKGKEGRGKAKEVNKRQGRQKTPATNSSYCLVGNLKSAKPIAMSSYSKARRKHQPSPDWREKGQDEKRG